jgi:predicted nucleic acid-binding protein
MGAALAYAALFARRQPAGPSNFMIASIAHAAGTNRITRDNRRKDCGLTIVKPWDAP